MKKLFGVVTAMLTPLDGGGRVMEESVARHVDFLIQKGVHCLYPVGSTGEMLLMETAERKRMAELVVRSAGGRVPVYIHVGSVTLRETLELARHAVDIGADGIAAVTPIYYRVSDEELFDYYSAIARAIPAELPLYLYNIPQNSENDISEELCRRLAAEFQNIVGMKYSYPDLLRTLQYMKARKGFSVLQGSDRLFDASLAIGCDGVISGISSVFPEPFVKIYSAFQNGDLQGMKAAQQSANEVAELLHCGDSLAYCKAAMAFRGIDMGHMVRPLRDLSQSEREELRESLLGAGWI